MPSTNADLYAPKIAALVREYGEVPPLWARFPRVHPYDIHWRMGSGEDYRYMFSAWVSSRRWSEQERTDYVRRWDPPFSWLGWVVRFVWPEDFVDGPSDPTNEHFARLEALGLGSKADWQRCFDVEPEAYPVADDVSSRWIEEPSSGS